MTEQKGELGSRRRVGQVCRRRPRGRDLHISRRDVPVLGRSSRPPASDKDPTYDTDVSDDAGESVSPLRPDVRSREVEAGTLDASPLMAQDVRHVP